MWCSDCSWALVQLLGKRSQSYRAFVEHRLSITISCVDCKQIDRLANLKQMLNRGWCTIYDLEHADTLETHDTLHWCASCGTKSIDRESAADGIAMKFMVWELQRESKTLANASAFPPRCVRFVSNKLCYWNWCYFRHTENRWCRAENSLFGSALSLSITQTRTRKHNGQFALAILQRENERA